MAFARVLGRPSRLRGFPGTNCGAVTFGVFRRCTGLCRSNSPEPPRATRTSPAALPTLCRSRPSSGRMSQLTAPSTRRDSWSADRLARLRHNRARSTSMSPKSPRPGGHAARLVQPWLLRPPTGTGCRFPRCQSPRRPHGSRSRGLWKACGEGQDRVPWPSHEVPQVGAGSVSVGVAGKPAGSAGGQLLPSRRQIWFFLVVNALAVSQVHWWICAPAVVETLLTSTHLPLWTATS